MAVKMLYLLMFLMYVRHWLVRIFCESWEGMTTVYGVVFYEFPVRSNDYNILRGLKLVFM